MGADDVRRVLRDEGGDKAEYLGVRVRRAHHRGPGGRPLTHREIDSLLRYIREDPERGAHGWVA